MSDQLPITNYQLPITHYQLPITHYPLPNQSTAFIDKPMRRSFSLTSSTLTLTT